MAEKYYTVSGNISLHFETDTKVDAKAFEKKLGKAIEDCVCELLHAEKIEDNNIHLTNVSWVDVTEEEYELETD
ncbi:hypothetical protein [Endozoicomonas sp. GU-1]|uniref:hypothetical protein n=1 Tax=Endozoicomonas sp. GU-1 TaxID=3009078 RepID=UPI0022B5476E|nr:hypothetical protein [Endozoicomonas sp. GU-1]WBA86507.1 hypothetical protein O3276_00150 [Endozoicomonas sp. GU-1]